MSSLKRFRFGSRTRASETVSRTVGWNVIPCRLAFSLMTDIKRRVVRDHDRTSQNARNSGRTSSIVGALDYHAVVDACQLFNVIGDWHFRVDKCAEFVHNLSSVTHRADPMMRFLIGLVSVDIEYNAGV